MATLKMDYEQHNPMMQRQAARSYEVDYGYIYDTLEIFPIESSAKLVAELLFMLDLVTSIEWRMYVESSR